MRKLDLFSDLVATYERHGWRLRSVLLTPDTKAELQAAAVEVEIKDAEFNALWFSRPSHQKRDAWELRLLSDTPYALFETFEVDETEEQQTEARQEMEARLREYVSAR
ncbi:MAG: hypothetical protein ABR555_01220 [Pyrinomonadaceae bacterium]